MSSNKTLSEIAKSLLVDNQEDEPESLREKAGLLALLNLLGIVDMFYDTQESAQKPATTTRQPKEIAPVQDTNKAASSRHETTPAQDSHKTSSNARHSLAELVSTISGESATPSGPAESLRENSVGCLLSALTKFCRNKEGALDPNIVTALIKMASSLARGKNDKPTGATSGENASVKPDEHTTLSETTLKIHDSGTGTKQNKSRTETQSSLGIDPKLITVLFNFLAGLDLPKTKSTARSGTESAANKDAEAKDDTAITLSSNGKAIIAKHKHNKTRSEPRTYHKPGFGIRKGWLKQTVSPRRG